MKITKIAQQKKNKKRFSIYVDDEYRIGISDELLVKYDLKVDDVMPQELLDTILVQEEKINIKNRILRSIQHRIKSTYELEQRFINDGYDQGMIDEVIDDLTNEGILNNDQLTRAYINDHTNINPHGNRHILFELKKKGIPERTILEMLSKRDEKKVAMNYFNRKLNKLCLKDPKDRRKAVNRLLNRGFTSSIVYEIVNERIKTEHDQ
ncbi:hypothetical protein A2Y85_02650 [candidate division WOR-3 bacterium RBG_13_43_14]|uniref:Regulatory protein RecX n=1 Tax=candidate division WOR-3 bacterium RBG_13_43_14 TaxID=1802590 RepID=A0A1F4UBI4_UNCW3|nr:MAG: hypothetical protein A2Y85_02650 [candidate division WOR-3 bacterium RBG_13_43_14]